MKTSTWIVIILLAVAIIFSVMAKPIKKFVSRGYRNNNPGNIRLTFSNGKKEMWQGEVNGSDKDFKTFQSMYWGYRAMFITLRSYLSKGYDTIEKIISRYAPSNENQTDAYIKAVAHNTGFGVDEKLSIADSEKLIKLVSAISYHENGVVADKDQIVQGYNLFIKS